MKKILASLVCFAFLAGVRLFAADGYLLEYETSGRHIGGTKIEGNLKIIFKNGTKRLSGATVFYEPGNPYPNIEEKEIIVDLPGKKKLFYVADAGQWTSTDLNGDFVLITDQKVKTEYVRNGSTAVLKIAIQLPVLLGGPSLYTVTYTYGKDSGKDAPRVKAISNPGPADVIGFYMDNQKFAEIIAQRLGEDRYQIPEKFEIVCEQGGKVAFDITGKIRVAQGMNLSDRDFQAK
jgi:hypothetical protein